MGVTTVQAGGIRWTDEEDNPVTEMNGKSLPTEIDLRMDSSEGDWSQEGLEDQVVELLREMYGATAEVFYLQY